MILTMITAPLFLLVSSVIALIPDGAYTIQSGITGMVSMFSIAFQFFPVDVWIAVFASIMFWVTVHFVYGVINFILNLIPILRNGTIILRGFQYEERYYKKQNVYDFKTTNIL